MAPENPGGHGLSSRSSQQNKCTKSKTDRDFLYNNWHTKLTAKVCSIGTAVS